MAEEIVCKFCCAVFHDLERYIHHSRVHKCQTPFQCVFECGLRCKSFEAYKKHLRLRHQNVKAKRVFRCTVVTCDCLEDSVKSMAKHLAKHLSSGQPAFCPFGCQTKKPFVTVNSMRIHNMYFHRNGNVQCLNNVNSEPENNSGLLPEPEESGGVILNSDSNEQVTPQCPKFEECSGTIINIFGTLFLKLLAKKHVTQTAIQEVITALGEAATVQNTFLASCCASMENKMEEEVGKELSRAFVTDLTKKLCNSNIFDAMFGLKGMFRSPHMRQKFYKEQYSFVPAISISLQRNNEHKDSFYYYVPILETLKAMLDDPNIYQAAFRKKLKVPGYLTDFDDGMKFKSSTFFTDKTINIFLYQDAAEMVVNAIGNATSRYKLLCMYMVLGNLDPHLRCKTENVQLVLLCKNKDFSYFGGDRVFRRLIEDIKVLEENGIVVHGGGFPENVRGSIFTTMNDNLGAHQIGGLVENFSTSSHFCRTCYIDHKSFKSDCLYKAELRTPETHVADLQKIVDNPSCIPYRGVKSKCIFDELQYFRMFDLGAAPCVAHDLFEGWINNDIFLILKRISKEHNISALYLQGRINEVCQKLKLDTKIAIDFARKSKNFKAKACDIWHMVQVLPFVLLNKQVDYDDPLILMLMLIKKITDIVTSPVVSETQIYLLRSLIIEYLELRKSMFDIPLRPKHHFTTHYPWLILRLGPLMSFCTLFCERKHCFFKRAIRSTLNFKNVVKFCAEQHQLYQALMGQENARFGKHFVVTKYVESYEYLSAMVQNELERNGLLSKDALYAEEASYCGYDYKKNYYLFLEHHVFGGLFYVVKIDLLIFNKSTDQIVVFGSKHCVTNVSEKGIMEVDIEPQESVALNITEFIDRAPLRPFCENNMLYLFIQHSIPLI